MSSSQYLVQWHTVCSRTACVCVRGGGGDLRVKSSSALVVLCSKSLVVLGKKLFLSLVVRVLMLWPAGSRLNNFWLGWLWSQRMLRAFLSYISQCRGLVMCWCPFPRPFRRAFRSRSLQFPYQAVMQPVRILSR